MRVIQLKAGMTEKGIRILYFVNRELYWEKPLDSTQGRFSE